MWGSVAVLMVLMAGDEALSSPPLVPMGAPEPAVVAPAARPAAPSTLLRAAPRLRGSVAVSGMGGTTFQQFTGGGGLTAELGTLRNDGFSIAAFVSMATTFVTTSMLSGTVLLSHVLGEQFTLGAGPTLLGSWFMRTPSSFGTTGLSVGGTVRGEMFLFVRDDLELRREGLSVSAFVTLGAPLLSDWSGLIAVPVTFVGGASIGWTWW